MNDANVIPLSATRAGSHTMNGHRAEANPVRLRFDAFELDEPNALLLCDGKAVTLAPKPFGVLCALARRPATLVTKHALLDDVWGHHFVTDSVLKTAISEVRAALHDDAKEPRYIETVSKRGYRFIASVGASSHAARSNGPSEGAGHDNPALAALTALCRGDAALADLIRKVAASLEREPRFLMDSLQERHA
jgi:DNA-binding winged helix-turn-helix (wHTH) protein